jgi:hypothetical protein
MEVVLSLSATAAQGGAEETTPAGCCVEVSDAWEQLQLGLGKKAGHMLRVMHRDDGVRVAMPEADWTMDRRVIQTRRNPHESPVLDDPVGAIPCGFRKDIADQLIYARFTEECAIYGGNLLLEHP